MTLPSPSASTDFTLRDLADLIRKRGVKLRLFAGGTSQINKNIFATFAPERMEHLPMAEAYGAALVTKHATEEEARDHAGASNLGFHWGRFSFSSMGLSGESFGNEIRRALGIKVR